MVHLFNEAQLAEQKKERLLAQQRFFDEHDGKVSDLITRSEDEASHLQHLAAYYELYETSPLDEKAPSCLARMRGRLGLWFLRRRCGRSSAANLLGESKPSLSEPPQDHEVASPTRPGQVDSHQT